MGEQTEESTAIAVIPPKPTCDPQDAGVMGKMLTLFKGKPAVTEVDPELLGNMQCGNPDKTAVRTQTKFEQEFAGILAKEKARKEADTATTEWNRIKEADKRSWRLVCTENEAGTRSCVRSHSSPNEDYNPVRSKW